MKSVPSIIDYQDINLFLKDWLAFKKKNRRGFSFEIWARQLGLSSRVYLQQVVSGKRLIQPEIEDLFLKYFDFDDVDALHFKDLVRLQKKMHQDRREKIFERIQKRQEYQKNVKIVKASRLFLQVPEISLLCTLLSFDDLHRSEENLAKILRISSKQLESALQTLSDLDLAQSHQKKNGEKIWCATQNNFKVPKDIGNEDLVQFHQQSLRRSAELFNSDRRDRIAECLMLPLNPDEYTEMVQWLGQFMGRCLQKFQSSTAKQRKLYRFQAALVPDVDM